VWEAAGDRVTIVNYLGSGGTVVIPQTIDGMPVIAIGNEACRERRLTGVIMPSSILYIGVGAFYGNELTGITIPFGVVFIGSNAFALNRLTSVVIPDSVAYIGWEAFYLNNLTRINIPASVAVIEATAFSANLNLAAINVAPDNPMYTSIDGVLYNKNITELIQWPGGKRSMNIPPSVTSIGRLAFYGSYLSHINIPQNVTSIEWWAFKGTQPTSITIGENVALGDYHLGYTLLGDDVSFDHAYNAANRRRGTYVRADGSSTNWTLRN
jgi:hypothetical protein